MFDQISQPPCCCESPLSLCTFENFRYAARVQGYNATSNMGKLINRLATSFLRRSPFQAIKKLNADKIEPKSRKL